MRPERRTRIVPISRKLGQNPGPSGNLTPGLPTGGGCMLAVMTVRNKVGLGLAGLLGLADFAGPSPAAIGAALLFPQPGNESDPFSIGGPAIVVVIVVAVTIGLATIAGVVLSLVRRNRVGPRVIAAARVVAVAIVLPVFLLQGLEAWILVLASAAVILNITTVILVLSRPAAS